MDIRPVTAVTSLGRPADALKDLANPAVGDYFDGPLWRSLAYADLGKWPEARRGGRYFNHSLAG